MKAQSDNLAPVEKDPEWITQEGVVSSIPTLVEISVSSTFLAVADFVPPTVTNLRGGNRRIRVLKHRNRLWIWNIQRLSSLTGVATVDLIFS